MTTEEGAKSPEMVLKDAVSKPVDTGEPGHKDEPKHHEPPDGSKRWNEVYGKMKTLERELARKEEDFGETLRGIQEHNRMLAEKLSGIEDGLEEQNRPDPTVDPVAYEKYLEGKLHRQMKKVQQAEVKPEKKPVQDVDRIKEQADALAEVFDDYEEVLAEVMPKIQSDKELAGKIFGAKNPPAALYKYGVEQRKKATERNTNLEQGYVEGGTRPVPKGDDIELTPLQERVRAGLGLTKEQYVAQLKAGGR